MVINIIPFATGNNAEFCLICCTYRPETSCSMENDATGGGGQNEQSPGCGFPYLLLHTGIWQDLTRGGPERCWHSVSPRGTRRPLAVSFWHICRLRWVPTPQLTEHCKENGGDRVKRSESRHTSPAKPRLPPLHLFSFPSFPSFLPSFFLKKIYL